LRAEQYPTRYTTNNDNDDDNATTTTNKQRWQGHAVQREPI
jgi:hypothetical protein